MIDDIHSLLKKWRADDQVSCIFLQGAGEKAFCAGGDVRRLYETIIEQRKKIQIYLPKSALIFFQKNTDLTLKSIVIPNQLLSGEMELSWEVELGLWLALLIDLLLKIVNLPCLKSQLDSTLMWEELGF